jgi:hypothetical protein
MRICAKDSQGETDERSREREARGHGWGGLSAQGDEVADLVHLRVGQDLARHELVE